MQLGSPDFLTKVPKTYDGKRIISSKMLLGKLDIHMQKTETRCMPVTLYKYQLKVD
jgi:hypothetical protein